MVSIDALLGHTLTTEHNLATSMAARMAGANEPPPHSPSRKPNDAVHAYGGSTARM